MELGSTEAVKEALMAGFGFSILSRISIRHELDEGTLVEVPVRGINMERRFLPSVSQPPAVPSHRPSLSRVSETAIILRFYLFKKFFPCLP